MFYFELLFFMQIVIGGLMIILLKKMVQLKKQVDDVVKEIYNYISFVTEEVREETVDRRDVEQMAILKKPKENEDELQNNLIQSVLGEYFL